MLLRAERINPQHYVIVRVWSAHSGSSGDFAVGHVSLEIQNQAVNTYICATAGALVGLIIW